MKHLKTYENTEEDLSHLKKYILWNGLDDSYYIFETGKHYLNQYGRKNESCREIFYKYVCNKQTKKLTKNEMKGNFSISIDNKKLILFQSDNIQDCIDMIASVETLLKFNI